MERKLSMPIISRTLTRAGIEKTVEKLKALKTDYVFLSIGPFYADPCERTREFAKLKENIRYFKEQGFTVGVWNWSFMVKGHNDFDHIEGVSAEVFNKRGFHGDFGFFEGKFVADDSSDLFKYHFALALNIGEEIFVELFKNCACAGRSDGIHAEGGAVVACNKGVLGLFAEQNCADG